MLNEKFLEAMPEPSVNSINKKLDVVLNNIKLSKVNNEKFLCDKQMTKANKLQTIRKFEIEHVDDLKINKKQKKKQDKKLRCEGDDLCGKNKEPNDRHNRKREYIDIMEVNEDDFIYESVFNTNSNKSCLKAGVETETDNKFCLDSTDNKMFDKNCNNSTYCQKDINCDNKPTISTNIQNKLKMYSFINKTLNTSKGDLNANVFINGIEESSKNIHCSQSIFSITEKSDESDNTDFDF